jgi:hypothetical protein
VETSSAGSAVLAQATVRRRNPAKPCPRIGDSIASVFLGRFDTGPMLDTRVVTRPT